MPNRAGTEGNCQPDIDDRERIIGDLACLGVRAMRATIHDYHREQLARIQGQLREAQAIVDRLRTEPHDPGVLDLAKAIGLLTEAVTTLATPKASQS